LNQPERALEHFIKSENWAALADLTCHFEDERTTVRVVEALKLAANIHVNQLKQFKADFVQKLKRLEVI
jgi:hypothetical protein